MTMQTGNVNFLAIIVAAAAYWIIGALWYSPVLFAKPWMKSIGKTKEELMESHSPIVFLWALIWSFVAAYGVARILVWTNGATVVDGVLVGALAGICFVFATLTLNNLFNRRSITLLLITAGHHIVGLIIAGIIIGAWR